MSTIVIPCLVIMVCYLKIFQFANQAKKKISDRKSNKTSQSDFKRSYKIAKGLFASYMVFVICWYEKK